jgi:predicted ATPase/class 3 adenylate cyclase/Tfp pilus assembly protein PilF
LHSRWRKTMSSLPSGTVTFLFTDIEGSTKLAQEHPETWEALRARYHTILRSAIERQSGYVFQIIGDAFCAAFRTAGDALRAATKSQIDLYAENWGDARVRVRMGVHTGKAEIQGDGQYHGYLAMSRVQRLVSAGHGGQVLISAATQELLLEDLPEDVSLRDLGERRLKDLIRPEHIYQLVIENLPADFPSLKTLEAYRHNLPAQMTTFIGREREIAEVKQAIKDHRLVTLTGSGGTGKTRLSLQVAADLLDSFPDGVWFIELAPLTDPDHIPQTILMTLGVGQQPGKTVTQSLIDDIRERKLLLVLDNCEHLINACAKLAEVLLNNAPGLRILASSREALGVRGELAWRVPSLSLPDIKHLPGIDQVSQYEAVRLFIECATLAQPRFTVTNENAPAIAQICFRLDGIPLAIELAAARVRTLSVEQISTRLDDRFHLLTGGSRTALPRQQTLRALIDWSYNLLSEKEKILLRRLAVFVGGWSLEAAEAVCTEDGLETYEMLDLLTNLVDKSLVFMEDHSGLMRYRRLETIRQYSREKFLEAGETEAVRRRQAHWFLQYAAAAEPKLDGKDSKVWLEQLEIEHDNLRAALEWLLATDPNVALQLAAVLGRFWQIHDYFTEGRKTLRRAQEASQDGDARWRAKALRWEGLLSMGQGDYEIAKQCFHEGLDLAQKAEDKDTLASILNGFGIVAWYQGDFAQARRYYEDGLALRRELGNKNRIATILSNLGNIAVSQGDHAEAKRFLQESVETFRQLDDKDGLAVTLNNLGVAFEALGDYAAAYRCYRESLDLSRDLGSRLSTGYTLNSLAHLMLLQGDFVASQNYYRESLVILKEISEKRGWAYCFEGLAMAGIACGNVEWAVGLLAAAQALRESMGAPLTASERAEYDQASNSARTKLDEAGFAAAWAQGRTMTIEQTMASALEIQHD